MENINEVPVNEDVKAEDQAEKLAKEQAKQAEKERKEAEKLEVKEAREAEKARKLAEKEALKAEKEALAEAKRKEKEDAKLAKAKEREDAKIAKEEEKARKLAEKEANRQPEQNGVRRPKPEGLCGRAWAIFDDITAKTGSPATIAESLAIAVQDGQNPSNVRTEYARWRKFNGITGRLASPAKAEAVENESTETATTENA